MSGDGTTWIVALVAGAFLLIGGNTFARRAVPQGSPDLARQYYRDLSASLKFQDTDSILSSTLDDVLLYSGYQGLAAVDLLTLDSDVLMDPSALGKPCAATVQPCRTAVSDPTRFQSAFRRQRLQRGEILAARFLAPKISNVNVAPEQRPLGWRKLVRLRARRGSAAVANGIETTIILFNFFTPPKVKPFEPSAESVNTQVMLLSSRKAFETREDAAAIYWLDYGPMSAGLPRANLSLQLDATFDAAELQESPTGTKPYYVPDGCVACHGEHPQRSLVNYLDTDHWFDRLDNDFRRVREEELAVLFDAGTNDPRSRQFARAFSVIRQFNQEAEQQGKMAQPQSFHGLANRKWLQRHERNVGHVPPVMRSLSTSDSWRASVPEDMELLGKLNQYCFRCHGTIRFTVFDKAFIRSQAPFIRARLSPLQSQLDEDPHFRMPPDRVLEQAEIDRLRTLLTSIGERR